MRRSFILSLPGSLAQQGTPANARACLGDRVIQFIFCLSGFPLFTPAHAGCTGMTQETSHFPKINPIICGTISLADLPTSSVGPTHEGQP